MTKPTRNERSRFFWFRKKVPVHLRAIVGKIEIKHTLGVTDEIIAREETKRLHAEWDRRFVGLSVEHSPLDHYAIDALAGEFYEAKIERHKREPGAPEDWKMRGIWAKFYFAHMPKIYCAKPVSSPIYSRNFLIEVDRFLIDKGLKLDPETRHRFLIAAGRLSSKAAERLEAFARHDYSGGAELPPDLILRSFPVEDPKRKPKNRYDRLFERFANEAGYPESTRNSAKARVAKFMTFCRRDYPADVTFSDAIAFKDHLIEQKLDPEATIRDGYFAAIRAFTNWCIANDLGPIGDPFERIKIFPDRNKRKRLPTKGYDDEEAASILSAALLPMSDEGSVAAAARRWIPWICATTGARVSEVAQLRTVDVVLSKRTRRFAPLPIIRFVLDAGPQKVAEREVPVHPDLIALGFLEFVKSASGERLFVDPSRLRTRSDVSGLVAKAGQRVAEWARSHLPPERKVQPNHAWRHRFNDLADEALVPPEMRDAISGHAPATEGARYGNKKMGVMLHWMKTMDSHLELVAEFHPEIVAAFPPLSARLRLQNEETARDVARASAPLPSARAGADNDIEDAVFFEVVDGRP